eukprot:COSAG03_NODE_596_length_6805_cov_73.459141_11_plen_81_part_00
MIVCCWLAAAVVKCILEGGSDSEHAQPSKADAERQRGKRRRVSRTPRPITSEAECQRDAQRTGLVAAGGALRAADGETET